MSTMCMIRVVTFAPDATLGQLTEHLSGQSSSMTNAAAGQRNLASMPKTKLPAATVIGVFHMPPLSNACSVKSEQVRIVLNNFGSFYISGVFSAETINLIHRVLETPHAPKLRMLITVIRT